MKSLLEAENLIADLREHGLKITNARQLVVEHVKASSETFTAEDLVGELPSVGRATIYRTLKILLQQGLICRVILEDGSVRYRLSYGIHHHHVICVSCGAVEDIDACEVDDLLANVKRMTSYQVAGHRVEVYGFCPDCTKRP